MGERIAVAMSGGVDSSVAAWLLQREGHELMGVTLRLFEPGDAGRDMRAPVTTWRTLGRWRSGWGCPTRCWTAGPASGSG